MLGNKHLFLQSLWTFLFISLVSLVHAQGRKEIRFSVAFYNVENLFDTIHDVLTQEVDGQVIKIADKNDYEFLPEGSYKWNSMKYRAKQQNMSEVIAMLGTGGKVPVYPAVIGLSEVENLAVLEELVAQPALSGRGYKIIHTEGPDRRGVDCAFLYNPKQFKLENYNLIPYQSEDTTYATRGFLLATGTILKEKFHFIVVHWPSRAAASPARERGGEQVCAIKDSLLQIDPASHIIVMGDMNDDPDDKSMAESLGAKRKVKNCGPLDLWNPFWDTLRKDGQGSLLYRGQWNLFDNIVLSSNLVGKGETGDIRYLRHEVFVREFLFQTEGKYKGYPKRTHAGGVWLNGYSDHLPTIVYFAKEVK